MISQTLSVARAAEALSTNKLVIERWVQEGKIPARWEESICQILAEPFERLRQDLEAWLASVGSADDDGVIRASIADLDEFWQERSR